MSNTTEKTTLELSYDSNPFTLSFKGFGLLLDYAKGVFIAMLVFGLLGFLLNIASLIPNSTEPSTTTTSQISTTSASTTSVDWGVVAGVGMVIFGVLVIVFAIGLLISAAFKGFVAAGAVAASHKRTITAGQAFSEMGERFGTLFVAEINTTLRILGGLFLLIIPGVRAQLRYQSTPYIIMSNKQMGASESVAMSKDLYRNHLMEAFGIATVGAIIPLIGQAIAASGMALSVQQLTEYKKLGKATPKTHWLNYLGLIFFVFIMFFITASIALLVAVTASN